ncbi:HAMP domain-containing sensor histidine kinase [Ramlibacter sp. PS3R-8]|uniref:sensor histidine kinase n=1 Tax=Ramlibacter sp. PS3R-8 TaxID=3133437 RepID=UPI00309D825E
MGRTTTNDAAHDASSRESAWDGYALALLAVAGGLGLRFLLNPFLGQQGPYLILALSVALAALYGGFGPGMFATALGTMAGTYLFVGHPGWEGVLQPPNITRTLLFIAIGVSISVIGGRLKASRRALSQSVLELRRSNRAKDQVLATVAHEIRNPLSALSTASEVLQRSATDPARVAWAAGIVSRQVRQIARMSDELMDTSKVLHGKIDMQMAPVDLRAVLGEAHDQVEAFIASKQHQLTSDVPDTPAPVRGDAGRLVQVFANLLNNAAKYTPAGGDIALKLSSVPAGWEVTITDTGQGFAQSGGDDLFEPFVQAPGAVVNETSGLGLGLAIVKRIVEMHGGSVVAHSAGAGKGATFTVVLPAIPAQTGAGPVDFAPLRSS